MYSEQHLDPALKALMILKQKASPTAPGPGGQPIPSVAGQMMQQAQPQQPQQPSEGLPGLNEEQMYGNLLGPMISKQNEQRGQQEILQAMKQNQQPQQMAEGGIAGLPSNVNEFAEGGVVGYADGGRTLGDVIYSGLSSILPKFPSIIPSHPTEEAWLAKLEREKQASQADNTAPAATPTAETSPTFNIAPGSNIDLVLSQLQTAYDKEQNPVKKEIIKQKMIELANSRQPDSDTSGADRISFPTAKSLGTEENPEERFRRIVSLIGGSYPTPSYRGEESIKELQGMQPKYDALYAQRLKALEENKAEYDASRGRQNALGILAGLSSVPGQTGSNILKTMYAQGDETRKVNEAYRDAKVAAQELALAKESGNLKSIADAREKFDQADREYTNLRATLTGAVYGKDVNQEIANERILGLIRNAEIRSEANMANRSLIDQLKAVQDKEAKRLTLISDYNKLPIQDKKALSKANPPILNAEDYVYHMMPVMEGRQQEASATKKVIPISALSK